MEECIFVYMALHFQCRFNKNSLCVTFLRFCRLGINSSPLEKPLYTNFRPFEIDVFSRELILAMLKIIIFVCIYSFRDVIFFLRLKWLFKTNKKIQLTLYNSNLYNSKPPNSNRFFSPLGKVSSVM